MVIDVKVKTKENKGEKWESLPVIGFFPYLGSDNPDGDKKSINEYIKENYADEHTFKIRWNYRGSLQGHYIEFQ